MKILAAFTLIVISMASAEPPRYRPVLARQVQNSEAAPYNPSGWRPSGPSFNTPERSANQQNYLPPDPKPSYGPPPEYQPSDGRPNTEEPITETPTTTEVSTEEAPPADNEQAENIKIDPRTGKVKSAAVKSAQPPQPGAYFVVLPQVEVQSQNLVVPVAPTVQERPALVTPLHQIPAQNYLLSVADVSQKTAALVNAFSSPLQIQRIVPITSSFRNEIYTPFSSSLVQIYQ